MQRNGRFVGGAPLTTPVEHSTGKEVIDDGPHRRLGAKFLRNYKAIFDYSRERMTPERRAEAVAARRCAWRAKLATLPTAVRAR